MERDIHSAINSPKLLVHQQFENWASFRPDDIALKYRDQHLTYHQLNVRANKLAHYLTTHGVGPECLVVVCVEPGFEILIALLAIFKVGAVYVPIDPTYPVRRIQAILADTCPKLTISNSYLLKKLQLENFATLALDNERKHLESLPSDNPCMLIEATQTAYVYYTSGTTGKPKGVMASYTNLVSYIQVAQNRYQFTNKDIMPAIARFGFSISMFELMLPLVSGGTLVILDRDHVLDLPRLTQTISQVTFFHAGPSLLKGLLTYIKLNHPSFDLFSKVRHASSGGDMIPPELLEDLKLIFQKAEIFVIYGCSEISCMGCTYLVPRNEKINKTYVGCPFDRMMVIVLDNDLKSLPDGEIGEIYFAGDGIVKGYLNRPDLTEKKFILLDGLRFYSTGDLGRKNGTGFLEVLGRTDFQIKIRGMRIEPSEVEYHLRQAPGVRDGVVASKLTVNGEKILVAYVVLEPSEEIETNSLKRREYTNTSMIRRHMLESLPDYMVPSKYIALPGLPLNHNMKLDRNALPNIDDTDLHVENGHKIRDPETTTETTLALIWKNLLNLRTVGLDDNFFDLGGQSLLALEFIVEVKKLTGIELDGMDVLRETLAVLASVCDRKRGIKIQDSVVHHLVPVPKTNIIEAFHFGPNHELFGVIHLPDISLAHPPEAVLLCAPIGQESVRTHFVLNKLAKLLATQGVPVFRFDYYGCGDSLGENKDATLERWRTDIVNAYQELRQRTNAERVVGVGVRLGATLLCGVLDRIELSRLIFWDPVTDGTIYYHEMREMHRKCVLNEGHFRAGRKKKGSNGENEIMEFQFSAETISELKALNFDEAKRLPTQFILTSTHEFSPKVNEFPAQILEFDASWNEVAQMNDILPDVGIVRAIATTMGETVCLA